jgi:hypothetical protein
MTRLKEIVSHLYSNHQSFFEKDEIEKILLEESDFVDDITTSAGAHIEISHVKIIGNKGTADSEAFDFQQSFLPGVNTIISDNLKGKSSIFKAITFAITGRNSLKPDISEWIKLIYVKFSISNQFYTSFIDQSGSRIKAKLYRTTLSEVIDESTPDAKVVFEASNKIELENSLEQFFYKQLGISSLKWTQKASRKDVNELYEAGTSWRTFFKTIYLESKDSDSLSFGAQEGLLFQILLGLSLTVPMNKLKIRKERLQFDLACQQSTSTITPTKKQPENNKSELESELIKANKELLNAWGGFDTSNSFDNLIKRKSELINEIQKLEDSKLKVIDLLSKKEKYIGDLYNKQVIYERDLDKIKHQINLDEKIVLKIQEHIEIGSFFSNLEIKFCPSCNTQMENNNSNEHDGSCQLCHHDMNNQSRLEDVSRLEKILKQKNKDIIKFKEQKQALLSAFKKLDNNIKDEESKKKNLNISSNDKRIMIIRSEVEEIDTKIENERKRSLYEKDEIKVIENKIAVLEFKLQELNKSRPEDNFDETLPDNTKIIELLTDAILYLEELRQKNNLSILEQLKIFILESLHSLGLKSFTDIHINSQLKLTYIQGGQSLNFSDITEGEQLRVKISLYLALVKLNSEYQVGHHPRILIVDSPGKEEADDTYFEGLIEALKTIDKDLSAKIQIIVGSADRRLVNIVNNDKQLIKEPKEFVF